MDSDVEDGDAKSYTVRRMENKEKRWCRRNGDAVKLSEKAGNKEIIEDFMKMRDQDNIASSTESSNLSTIRKNRGHLFEYFDSWLEYKSSIDPSYSLDRHLALDTDQFLEVEDSREGVSSVAGPDGKGYPSRHKEMLKSY